MHVSDEPAEPVTTPRLTVAAVPTVIVVGALVAREDREQVPPLQRTTGVKVSSSTFVADPSSSYQVKLVGVVTVMAPVIEVPGCTVSALKAELDRVTVPGSVAVPVNTIRVAP
jgi:hypothetical protein